MRSFREKFNFDPQRKLFVGVERECFLTREGKIVPIAHEIISKLHGKGNYGYELSACQLEMRTNPAKVKNISRILNKSHVRLRMHEEMYGFKTLHTEVAPYDMPLDVYPDPTGRYQVITKDMPSHILQAACRVAGTHVHVGMPSAEKAIHAYNAAILHLPTLCKMGDKSEGERLQIYKVMAPDFNPPQYKDWNEFEEYATTHNFTDNPRNCWHMIRISVHGTIEFRVFGATPYPEEIVKWAHVCHDICKSAL